MSRRNGIVDLEASIRNSGNNLGVDAYPLKHHFAPGVYVREILIPADNLIVGKIHKHDHLIIFMSGDVSISSEKGTERISMPGVSLSTKGIKRAVYAHVDSIILTIHPTDEVDLDKIEEEVIASSFDDFCLTKQNFEVLP